MTFSLRRLIITIIFVLIIGATTVASVFLNTFDLNSFRAQISDSISVRLSQPVNLGQARFSIKHGPSFAFNNVLIGTKNAPLYLRAEHVFFRLEVLPLLVGNFKFSEILFENPNVILKLGQKESADEAQQRLVIDQSLVSGDLLKSIRIRNGHFRVEDYRGRKTPFVFALEKLRMVVDDLSLRQSGWIELQADINCNNIRSPLRINGYVRAGDSSPFWNNAHYELEMRVSDFASDVLSQRYRTIFSRAKIHGRTDIHLQLSGSPAEGLKFNSVLKGRDLGLVLPGRKQPIPAGKIAATGNWQNTNQLHKITDLHLQFGTMEAFGETTLDLRKPDPELQVHLRAPRVALTDFNRFILKPQNSSPHAEFTAGTFSLENFSLSGNISRLSGPEGLLAIKSVDLEIKKGEISFGEKLRLKNCNVEFLWADNSLQIKRIGFNAKGIKYWSDGDFKLKQDDVTESLQLLGQGNFRFKNLVPDRLILPPKGVKATLFLDTIYQNGTWTLKDNLLAFPSLKMVLQGEWAWETTKEYFFDINVPAFSLLDLPLISPAVRAINPEGEISANIHFSGGQTTPGKLQGKMTLKNAHLKMLGPLAALDKLNGSIELDWPHLGGQALSANLGESAITLGLNIPDLRKPKVDLQIKGESIRANELIFRSEKTFLRDVDANLSITDKALILGPIHTRMDGGTNVTINGTIDNFPTPDTRLNIEGKYGNIDEVIGLWISEKDRNRKKRKKKKPGLLEIDIKTDAGEIANLPFEQCEAHISYRNRTLVIHPIKFKSGPGYGLGQVLVVYRDNQPPLLRMSGHLEDFDALAVYQQLLQRKGIVTGRLRGDFYLQGTAGKLKETFLPSSFGAFNFEVRDGTLKKLRGLSQALTVFNIYPMFSDSGQERGVPFSKVTGNARLDNGTLKTGNLFLKGNVMNMSMRGEQNLITSELDMEMGIMPLRTLDRLVTNIPLAGWVLAGEDKALVTAHFKMTGPGDDPKITPIPVESASKQVLGVFKRLFTLPVKIISDVEKSLE